MSYTPPTDDIIVQDGTFAFDYMASGTIYAGQAVYAGKTSMYVKTTSATGTFTPGCVGIAAYKATDDTPIAVYGPGNICRAIVSGTCTVGDSLFIASEGKLGNNAGGALDAKDMGPSGVYFIALDTVSTNGDTVRVLIV